MSNEKDLSRLVTNKMFSIKTQKKIRDYFVKNKNCESSFQLRGSSFNGLCFADDERKNGKRNRDSISTAADLQMPTFWTLGSEAHWGGRCKIPLHPNALTPFNRILVGADRRVVTTQVRLFKVEHRGFESLLRSRMTFAMCVWKILNPELKELPRFLSKQTD